MTRKLEEHVSISAVPPDPTRWFVRRVSLFGVSLKPTYQWPILTAQSNCKDSPIQIGTQSLNLETQSSEVKYVLKQIVHFLQKSKEREKWESALGHFKGQRAEFETQIPAAVQSLLLAVTVSMTLIYKIRTLSYYGQMEDVQNVFAIVAGPHEIPHPRLEQIHSLWIGT